MTTRPRPVPDAITAFYWDAAARGELAVLQCEVCGLAHSPPEVACPHCGASALAPQVVGGRGTVFASCVVRQAFDAAFIEAVPYVLVLVELDDRPGVRVLTNLAGVGGDPADVPEPVPVGTPVEVVFEPQDDWVLPQFRLAPA